MLRCNGGRGGAAVGRAIMRSIRIEEASPMSTLAFALLVFVAVAACTFWIASGLYGHGSPWARDVCGLSRALCDHPMWGAFATAASAVLYLALRGLRL